MNIIKKKALQKILKDKGKSLFKERRKYPRGNLLAYIDLTNNESKKGGKFKCVMMNVSKGGLGIISEKLINKGACKIQIQDLKLTGKILYRIEHTKGVVMDKTVYYYGIKLDKLLSEKELKSLKMISYIQQSKKPGQ